MISFATLQKERNNLNETSGFKDPTAVAFKMILRYPPRAPTPYRVNTWTWWILNPIMYFFYQLFYSRKAPMTRFEKQPREKCQLRALLQR